jgi:hypothetical protein
MGLVPAKTSPPCDTPFGNKIFLSRYDGDATTINDQGIATPDHNHVFVVIVHVRRRTRHLATTVESRISPMRAG